MTKISVEWNYVRDLCYRAAKGEGRGEDLKPLCKMLRSDYQLTADDRNYLADFIEGKMNRGRGRPQKLEEESALERMEQKARTIQVNARERGERITLAQAINRAIDSTNCPEESRAELQQKLSNYVRRSKRPKRSAKTT